MEFFSLVDADSIRMFTCKKLRYLWDTSTNKFMKIKSLGPGLPTSIFHHPDAQQGYAGLSVFEQQKRYILFLTYLIFIIIKTIFFQTRCLWSKFYSRSSEKYYGTLVARSAKSLLHIPSGFYPHMDHDRILLFLWCHLSYVCNWYYHIHYPNKKSL